MAQKDAEIAKIIEQLPKQFHKRYLEREGYFGDVRSSQAPRRLQTCAEDIWKLLDIFKEDLKISKLKQFKILKRLFKEQCEIVNSDDDQEKIQAKLPDSDEKESTAQTQLEDVATSSTQDPEKISNSQPTIEVKDKRKIGADSLQSPTDPDATYGHKGKGYEYQIAETCDRDNPFQVITETHLNGANESDQTQTIPMIEKLDQANTKPKELQVDAGYVSGKNIVNAQDQGVELIGPLPGKPASDKMSLIDFEFNKSDTRIVAMSQSKISSTTGRDRR